MSKNNVPYLKKFNDSIYYLHDYTPFIRGNQNSIDKKIMDIKSEGKEGWMIKKQKDAIAYFRNELNEVLKAELSKEDVICRVPRSKCDKPENHVYTICKGLVDDLNLIDGTNILKRVASVPESHIDGNRCKEKHIKSISVQNKSLIKNKVVCVIDDVVTSGTTMEACCELLINSGAKKVICVCIGKTIME